MVNLKEDIRCLMLMLNKLMYCVGWWLLLFGLVVGGKEGRKVGGPVFYTKIMLMSEKNIQIKKNKSSNNNYNASK